ncbi:6-carboxytetrahydropterin synthase QueD [Anaerobaca lacustris]|uniref:6-carboxy-5,6,7,8-tetrahydropterin synthase n=1 Tax=Anaerobaca lacustris TaxID=3044600 RepID=A0AAW6TU51_9BACT|nr:6-carboxytetrahydropterin synthase QueD [Sedimentisphaerales bacterium M17dextr]
MADNDIKEVLASGQNDNKGMRCARQTFRDSLVTADEHMSGKSHFEVQVQLTFSAAHHLRGYPGNCEKPHGHNWTVDIAVECEKLNEIGIGIDFRDVKAAARKVVEQFDHCDLNTLEPFRSQNPTSENVAKYLYRELAGVLNNESVRVANVRVSEGAGCSVLYWED